MLLKHSVYDKSTETCTQTSTSVDTDGPPDAASNKIEHIALHAECNPVSYTHLTLPTILRV